MNDRARSLVIAVVVVTSCAAPSPKPNTVTPEIAREEPVTDASVAVAVDATDAGGEIAISVGVIQPSDWSRRSSSWHCPCSPKQSWGGKAICPHHAQTCTRRQLEEKLRCGYKLYTCGEYVVVQLPDKDRALDEPLVGAAFGIKSGKLVAVAEWQGLFVSGAMCPCDGPSDFSFPDLDDCRMVEVPCPNPKQQLLP